MSSLFEAAAASRPTPESSSGDLIDLQLFAKSGTAALSHEQRLARAKKKGLCARCGIKTHNMKVSKISRRSSSSTPVTDEDVHEGHCILCDPDMVPMEVVVAWEERHPERIVWAKCTSQHAQRGIYRKQQEQPRESGNIQEQLQHQVMMKSSSTHSRSYFKNTSGRTGKTDRESASSSRDEIPIQSGHHQETSIAPEEELSSEKATATASASVPIATAPLAKNSLDVSEKCTNLDVSQKSAASSDGQDHCAKCGIQTHEKIKIKASSGFMKRKSKIELRPVSVEGSVLEGRCLSCLPLSVKNTNTENNIGNESQNQASAEPLSPPSLITGANEIGDSVTKNGEVKTNQPQVVAEEIITKSTQSGEEVEKLISPEIAPWTAPLDSNGDEVNSDVANGHQSETSELAGAQNENVDATAATGAVNDSPSFAAGIPSCISVQPSSAGEESGQQGENNKLAPPQQLGGPQMSPIEKEHSWSMPWPLNKPAEDNEDESSTDEETDLQVASTHSSSVHGRPPLHASDSWGRMSCSSRKIEESGYSLASTRMSATNHEMDGSGNSFSGSRMSGTSGQINGSGSSFASSRMTNSSRVLQGSRRGSFTGGLRNSGKHMNDSVRSFSTNNSKRMSRVCSMPIPNHLAFDESHQDSMSVSKGSQAGDTSGTGNPFIAEMMAANDIASWLRNLATEARDNEEFRAEVAEGGCILAVIFAMKHNKAEGLVQQQGCVALHTFAKEYGAAIARHGGANALSSAMKHHGEQDPILQEHAAGALVYTAVNDGYKAAVAKRGGISCILAAMRRYADNLGLQKRSCMALLKLSSHREIIDSLTSPKHRGVHIVVESMKRHEADLAVSQYASGILKNIAQKEGAGSLIVEEGGVSALLRAMKKHKENVILNQQATWALFEISSSENIAKHGSIKYTIAAMRAHKLEESIQQYACGVLANLSITKENIYAVAKLKGITPLLDAMEDHKENAALQRYACRTLKHLSLSGTNEKAIGKKEGIKILFTTMNVHNLDGTVQREAIGALRNLTLSEDNKSKVQKNDIGAIFDAVGNNIYDSSVQEKAAGALLNLSSSSIVRRSFDLKETKKLVAMMRQQSNSPKVQELLCGTLKNLALGAELKQIVGQSEGINTILAAMKRHNGSTKLLVYALAALKNLAGNAENRQEIGKQQGIIAVLSIMKQHLSVAAVQQEANGVLLNLSILKENSYAIGKHGGILAIITAMKHHPTIAGVQSSACAALWNLSVAPDNQKLIYNDSGIAYVITGLEYHVNDLAVCHKACLALANMAVSDAYRSSITECGGVEAVVGAMSLHEKDASCQKYACKFLVAMLDGGSTYHGHVHKSVASVKQVLQQHPANPDVLAYAKKILSGLSVAEDESKPESAPAETTTPAESASAEADSVAAKTPDGAVGSIEC